MRPFFILLVLLWAGVAAAQSKVTAEWSASSVRVGETVILTISVDRSPGESEGKWSVPQPEPTGLRLVRQGESEETLPGPILRHRFVFEFQAIQPGSARVDSGKLVYADPESLSPRAVPYDIPSIIVKRRMNFALPAAAFCAAAAGMVVMIVRRRRRPANSASPLTLEAIAVTELRASLESIPASSETVRRLDRRFRRYLTERFSLEWTAGDDRRMIERLEEKGLDRRDAKSLVGLLSRAREGAYSGKDMAPDEVRSLAKEMISFVEGKMASGD